ncbi:hypothetical protein VULLAG_LOCUS21408 [Vulpes lagopus]
MGDLISRIKAAGRAFSESSLPFFLNSRNGRILAAPGLLCYSRCSEKQMPRRDLLRRTPVREDGKGARGSLGRATRPQCRSDSKCRREGRKEGGKEGRRERMKERRKEATKERRKEGRKMEGCREGGSRKGERRKKDKGKEEEGRKKEGRRKEGRK